MKKPLNLALIGCGMISRYHLEALKGLSEYGVAGVWDIVPEAARKLGAEFGVKTYSAYEEILADPSVDVVDICLPSGLHAEYGIRAAKAGKHCIVEKPLDVTGENVAALNKAARENGVFVACIFPYRFTAAARRIKDALDAGLLGRLLYAEAAVKWFRSEEYYAQSGWKGTRRLDGGGALMNQSIHVVDLLLWYMGGVRNVASLVRTARHNIEVEDLALALLEFENGAVGNITGATALKPGFPERLEIYGEKGSIAYEGGRIVRWLVDGCREDDYLDVQTGPSASADPAGITPENHRRQFKAIAEAWAEGRKPPVHGEEAERPVRLILDIYAADGGWVKR